MAKATVTVTVAATVTQAETEATAKEKPHSATLRIRHVGLSKCVNSFQFDSGLDSELYMCACEFVI